MNEELDERIHPKVTVRRKLLGMDFNAGAVAVFGVVSFVVIAGIGVATKHMLLGLIGGAAVGVGLYTFARKFINNRPSTYFNDWVASLSQPNYIPKKYRNTFR